MTEVIEWTQESGYQETSDLPGGWSWLEPQEAGYQVLWTTVWDGSDGHTCWVQQTNPRAPRYLVVVEGCFSEDIYIRERADMVAFYHLVWNQSGASTARIQQTVDKAFQAWHGHDALQPCPTCDPESWKREQKMLKGT